MEPASILATVALAAATILPSNKPVLPSIEVTLDYWDNETQNAINVYYLEHEVIYSSESEHANNCLAGVGAKPIAQLVPGYNRRNISIPIKQSGEDCQSGEIFATTTLRVIPSNDPNHCLELIFRYVQEGTSSFFEVDHIGICISRNSTSSSRGMGKRVTWENKNPPSYINAEVGGKIFEQKTLDNSQVSIELGIVKLERLK
ncbi:hypothetical protein BH09DEP1_BH09DEP1_0480 [soil metagenome]